MGSKKHEKEVEPTVDQMLAEVSASGFSDTASDLAEIYESIERSYRAACLAGRVTSGVSQSTNY